MRVQVEEAEYDLSKDHTCASLAEAPLPLLELIVEVHEQVTGGNVVAYHAHQPRRLWRQTAAVPVS